MNNKKAIQIIKNLNGLLFSKYGLRGWWPITATPGKAPVYHPGKEGREMTDNEALEIITGAILTQNTSWSNVEKALINLTGEGMLTLEQIADSGRRLSELIRPSGYYNQKSDRLRGIARNILDLGGIKSLRKMETERLRSLLLLWKGIGPETADSILCYGFSRPIFVVDNYTKRLFEKLGIPSDSYKTMQDLVHSALPPDAAVYGDFHARIVKAFTSKEVEDIVEAL